MTIRRKIALLPLLLLPLLPLVGCEDDPILQPTDESSGGGGGSYGRIDKIGLPHVTDDSDGPAPLMADPTLNPTTF